MTAAQYDECFAALKKAGAHHPRGRHYHACFGTGDKVQVFDVWESKEDFDKFGELLLPILQQMGVDPGAPMISEIHSVVVPPAKAPAKAKAAKVKAAKAAGTKKRAKPAVRKKIVRRRKK